MKTTTTCPTCGGAAPRKTAAGPGGLNKAFPFCSARCQMIDLGRWLDEEYRIPEGVGDVSGGGTEGVPAPGEERSGGGSRA